MCIVAKLFGVRVIVVAERNGLVDDSLLRMDGRIGVVSREMFNSDVH